VLWQWCEFIEAPIRVARICANPLIYDAFPFSVMNVHANAVHVRMGDFDKNLLIGILRTEATTRQERMSRNNRDVAEPGVLELLPSNELPRNRGSVLSAV
jgi:hypothetical protein